MTALVMQMRKLLVLSPLRNMPHAVGLRKKWHLRLKGRQFWLLLSLRFLS